MAIQGNFPNLLMTHPLPKGHQKIQKPHTLHGGTGLLGSQVEKSGLRARRYSHIINLVALALLEVTQLVGDPENWALFNTRAQIIGMCHVMKGFGNEKSVAIYSSKCVQKT